MEEWGSRQEVAVGSGEPRVKGASGGAENSKKHQPARAGDAQSFIEGGKKKPRNMLRLQVISLATIPARWGHSFLPAARSAAT